MSIDYKEQAIEDLIPGTYIRIIENTAKADVKTVAEGKTVTALCVAPDFLLVPDTNSTDPDKIKFVRLEANTLYPIDDPNTYAKYFTGENIRETLLTVEQKESFLFSKDLVKACEMAADLDTSFAIWKLAKRDGTSPDPNNKFEIAEALQFALESLKTAKAGTIVPFHWNLGDASFGLTAEELDSLVTLSAVAETPSTLNVVDGVSYNSVFIDVERDYEAKVEFVPSIPVTATVPADLVNATAGIRVTIDGDTVTDLSLTASPKLTYNAGLKASNGTVVGGLVLAEDITFGISSGDLKLTVKAGTPVFSVAVDGATGKLIKDSNGAFVVNYALADTTKTLANQSFLVTVVASENPCAKVTSVLEPTVYSGIKLLQGLDADNNRNFSPAKAKSFLINFELNEVKKTVNLVVNEESLPLLNLPVVADKSNKDLFIVSKKTIIKLEDGVTIIFPKDLKVYDKGRTFTDKASIYYNVLEVVGNNYAYKINVVPNDLNLANEFARVGAELTSKADETFIVLPTVGILGDSDKEIKSAVDKALAISVRGTLIAKMSAGKQYDLGRHILMPFGSLKSNSSIGGCKAEKSTIVTSFDPVSVGATKATRVIIARDSSVKKGDLVEFSTYKRINIIKASNRIIDVVHKSNATYIELETPVDLKVFDQSVYDVTLNFVNNKDLKGVFTAFQYALIIQKYANKAPVRLTIPGTAEVILDDYLDALNVAGFTVINGDTAGNAKVEFTPTAAAAGTMFSDAVNMGILFYILKKCRKIGVSIEGTQMNDPMKQLDYNNGLRAIESAAINTDKLCSSCAITPDYTNLKTLRNKIEFQGVSPTQKVIYIYEAV